MISFEQAIALTEASIDEHFFLNVSPEPCDKTRAQEQAEELLDLLDASIRAQAKQGLYYTALTSSWLNNVLTREILSLLVAAQDPRFGVRVSDDTITVSWGLY